MSTSRPVQKTTLPFQQQSVATSQSNIALPYVRGTQLVAAIIVSSSFNKITRNVQGNGKKG